jgi:hypothetical protein
MPSTRFRSTLATFAVAAVAAGGALAPGALAATSATPDPIASGGTGGAVTDPADPVAMKNDGRFGKSIEGGLQ